MTVSMSPETEQRALDLLQVPTSALAFADQFWPAKTNRPPGKRSLAGHATLRRLIESGLVRRIEGPTPSADLFVASDASPEGFADELPPELQMDPRTGQVVEVQRRAVGRIANGAEQQPEGEIHVDPVTGMMTRVQVIGRAQVPAPAQAPAPPAPQAPPAQPPPAQPSWEQTVAHQYAQIQAWCGAWLPEAQEISAMIREVLYSSRLDDWERAEKTERAQERLRRFIDEGCSFIGRVLGVPAEPEPPPRRPPPRRAPPPWARGRAPSHG